MKARFTATFEIDVSDWYEDERLTKAEKTAKLKEDLADYSVFMLHAQYQALKDCEVSIIYDTTP